MIIELDTKLLDYPETLNLNQIVFLSMILDKNQNSNQDVRKIVSLISDDEISYLIRQDLVTLIEKGNKTIYKPTEKLTSFVKPTKDYFDLFYDMYPVYVVRPDGSKSYLRANINKCRHLYNVYVGNSKSMAEHINNCLSAEISNKMMTGKLTYMKTMWRWLVDHQWEEIEEQVRNENIDAATNSYGTELI